MLEKIPVGGWRHAEARVVEVFAGKAKARDVVPNWPRGRSTSKPLAAGVVWPWLYAFSMTTGEYLGEYSGPGLIGLARRPMESKTLHLDWAARAEDRVGEQAEERRKAEMMEGWYEQQRMPKVHPPRLLSNRFSFRKLDHVINYLYWSGSIYANDQLMEAYMIVVNAKRSKYGMPSLPAEGVKL